MNPIESVHPSHSTQHSFAPVTNHLNSNNFTSTVAHASNQFGIKANPAAPQAMSAPLQPHPSIFPSQHTVAPSQSFSQMNGSNAGIQTAGIQAATQGIISEAVPHSDTAPTHPAANNYPHQINGLGGPTATAPFLQDFSLVAEAAKRAQLSIVMRDLESVTL